MDPSIRNPRTFVRSVKSNNLFPLQIEEVMEEIRNPAPTLTSMNHRVDITKDDIHGTKWVILSFAVSN
jgi:hypothetical protein